MKKKTKELRKVIIYTSKELRKLLGANSEGEGADREQVEVYIKAKNLVSERVKGI